MCGIGVARWQGLLFDQNKEEDLSVNKIDHQTKMNSGETKTDATDAPNAENDSILAFLAPFLVYPVATDDTPPYERIAWWKMIFSYLGIKKIII